MSWWTEQSIAWYERASRMCSYHEDLVNVIEPFLDKSWTISEPGCGLGYEAEILRKRGYDMIAFDKDERAIANATKRSSLDMFSCHDFVNCIFEADSLLCINFAHVDTIQDLEALLSHARRSLVYVMSRHRGCGKSSRIDRSGLVESLVNQKGLAFRRKDFELDFDQPLESMDEAKEFLSWTYPNDDLEGLLECLNGSDDPDYPFVFRNRKEMTLFAISK